MRYLTLITAQDEYDSTLGFKLKGAKAYDGEMVDRGDIILAHDIVEHQNGLDAIGSVWDELQALGGVWHARGRWGDMMQKGGGMHSPAANIASDIVRMARDVSAYGFRSMEAMGIKPKHTRAHDHDDDFKEILEIARQDIPAELDDDCPLDLELYLSEALDHMRIGYRKACARFGDRFRSNNQLGAIKEAVTEAVYWIDYEGQEFRLGWGGGKCSINPIYEGYGDDY